MNKYYKYIFIRTFILVIVTSVTIGCSTTSSLEDGEQLFIGLKPIDYSDGEGNSHLDATKTEIEAALATAPNGALFGSSYYRTPFPYGLWIWNAYSQSNSAVAKWFVNSFGKAPVLMSNVNPTLRASIATSVLENYGYFNGNITYDILEGEPTTTKTDSIPRPRTAKIQYHVDFGHLYTLDSIWFTNYPQDIYNKIATSQTILKSGNPFSISDLENERMRIYNLLRNKGYYYYQPSHTTFFADTIMNPGKVQLQVQIHFMVQTNQKL